MATPLARSVAGIAAVLAVVAAVSAGAADARPAPASTRAAAPQPVAQDPGCPDPGDLPGIGGPPGFTDANVAVFAGTDLNVRGESAEAEGLVVALGGVDVDKSNGGTFNVGTVGAGSQISPPPGSDMLISGGDLRVGPRTVLDVGSGATNADGSARGGNVAVTGTITNQDRIETNGGAVINPSNAADRYAGFPATLRTVSDELTARGGAPAAASPPARLDFPGDGTSAEQFFSVSAAAVTEAREFRFTGIPVKPNGAYAPIVVNVIGGPTVGFSPTFFSIDGNRVDDLNSPHFGDAAGALLWNFGSATDVTVGGTSQVMGSILIPASGATTTVSASTNGRLYTGGSLLVQGAGNELHNYPWQGNDDFDCEPDVTPPGPSITITKTLPPGTSASNAVFHGSLRCADPPRRNIYQRDWAVRPGRRIMLTDLPVGNRCTVSENLAATDRPGDDLSWARPVWTVNGRTTDEFTVADGVDIEASVHNALLASFEIAKHVRAPAASGAANGRHEYAIDWACDEAGYTLDADGIGTPTDARAGTVHVAAGSSALPTHDGAALHFPLGTRCTFDEAAPPDSILHPGYTWTGHTVSPRALTVGTDAATRVVTVTNVAEAVTEPPGSGSGTSGPPGAGSAGAAGGQGAAAGGTAGTGTDVAMLLETAAIFLAAGAASAAVGRARRRRARHAK